MSFFICHYVILSYKNHQFLSVTLLFCLQKTSVSLCHYVIMSSKKTSVSFRPSVILSSKNICLTLSLCHSVFKKNICLLPSLCYSVFKKKSVSLCHYVIMSSKKICHSFSLCHYVGRQRIQNLDKTVQKKQKRGCVYYDTPSFVMLLPRRGNQFSASFLFLSSICDVFYSNVHISCNNLCITLEVFSVVPLQVAFKSPYRRQS